MAVTFIDQGASFSSLLTPYHIALVLFHLSNCPSKAILLNIAKMLTEEEQVILRYQNAKRNLDLIAGLCFLISIIICPTLYFVFGNLVFILFLPVFLLVIIECLATLALMIMKRRALRKVENLRNLEEARNPTMETEPKKLPKKISGIITIPQHEHALQMQLAQIHYAYDPPNYEQPPPYRMVILNTPISAVQQQQINQLRY
ncbi:uncharacterized protein LOC132199514 [Neocloeon triangulifer]|uniref:uncharacterized protein LOC132199514 n=1 Tax=Neocloeon triangulifer TaxID=2078957 RepID=UPI00286F5D21|nr:uncharacterized protein LOC132199514 [Neocloeon triangulifer]